MPVIQKTLWDAAIARILLCTISVKIATVHVEVGKDFILG